MSPSGFLLDKLFRQSGPKTILSAKKQVLSNEPQDIVLMEQEMIKKQTMYLSIHI